MPYCKNCPKNIEMKHGDGEWPFHHPGSEDGAHYEEGCFFQCPKCGKLEECDGSCKEPPDDRDFDDSPDIL